MFNDDVFSLADDVTTITLGGQSYRAIIRRATRTEQQTLHGIAETSVTVFTVEPTASPTVGGTITYDGADFRILSAELRAHETRWTIFTTTDAAPTPPASPTETISAIAITNADTEYSIDLGMPTHVQFRCRDNTSVIRWALESGLVASATDPYRTLQARGSQSLSFDGATSVTLYAASGTGNVVLEILSR